MSHRHLARSLVMQTLFEWDFHRNDASIVDRALEDNIEEFAPGIQNPEFVRDLTQGVVKKQKILDEIIEKAAPEWPIQKINSVDRNILRMGLYELLFGDRTQVPPKVAINEAIELAKSFSGENSGRFINGVLGAVYRELGEPGKNDVPKKKQPVALTQEEFESLPIEHKAAGVVAAKDGDTWKVAMVHDVFDYWTLPKGGVDDIDDVKLGAVREIEEEIGLKSVVIELLGENTYVAHHPQKGRLRKQVSYFLMYTDYQAVELKNTSGGLDKAQWFTLSDLVDITTYDDVLEMLTKSVSIITAEGFTPPSVV